MARRRTPRASPGRGTILRKSRSRRAGGADVRNSWGITFEVNRDLVYDIDATKLVEHVSQRLAEHHRDSILKGRHPSGGSLRKLETRSLDGTFGTRGSGRTFFHNSGESAKSWLLGEISGGSITAKRFLKPVIMADTPGKFDWVINAWLDRGIDLQSVKGQAAVVIQKAVDEYVSAGFGSSLFTPTKQERSGGFLRNKRTRLAR